MTVFRPCPTYPGYEASFCGIVRRVAGTYKPRKGNTAPKPPLVLSRVGRNRAYHTISGKFVPWVVMVSDAWHCSTEYAIAQPSSYTPKARVWGESVPIAAQPVAWSLDEPRPRSSYRHGRILTVSEWRDLRRMELAQLNC